MTTVFISYGRGTQDKVRALAQDLESLGHEAWFDLELTGGQAWWDQVLANIRECDAFVFALAPASLDSQACRLEYAYADALNKNILPVLIVEGVAVNLLPPALAKIQYLDYRAQDKKAGFALARAIATLPPVRALPDPLPQAPVAPLSYLSTLSEQVDSAKPLSFEEQTAMLVRLKQGMKDVGDEAHVRALLKRFRAREDLLTRVSDEIDELLWTQKIADVAGAHAASSQASDTLPPQRHDRQADKVLPHGRVASRGIDARPAEERGADGDVMAEAQMGGLAKYVLLALGGGVIGFLLPAIALDSLGYSVRRSLFGVFLGTMILGLLPVLIAQLTILHKGGRHLLARRWKWFVPAGWVIGAFLGGLEGSFFIVLFGAIGGGIAAIVLVAHAYFNARSKPRTVSTTG